MLVRASCWANPRAESNSITCLRSKLSLPRTSASCWQESERSERKSIDANSLQWIFARENSIRPIKLALIEFKGGWNNDNSYNNRLWEEVELIRFDSTALSSDFYSYSESHSDSSSAIQQCFVRSHYFKSLIYFVRIPLPFSNHWLKFDLNCAV